MRKLFLFLLLIAGWAVIFSPFLAGTSTGPVLFVSQARPSGSSLPEPWQDSPQIQLNQPDAPGAATILPEGFPPTGAACGETYTVTEGDTLGEIARDCGISLVDLLNANPQIENPNRVFTGQQIRLPDPLAGRGGGDLLAIAANPVQAGGYVPGGEIKISIAGLPTSTPVRVGLGLSVSGYSVLSQNRTDTEGRLSLTLRLPVHARPGEAGFFMVTTTGVPSIQRVSESFTIGEQP